MSGDYDSVSTNLLNYDQVVALSQATVNAQLQHLYTQGLITNTVDISVDADNYFNATIGSPTVEIFLGGDTTDPGKVILAFPITGGSAQGMVFGNPVGVADLSGYSARFTVNLGMVDPLSDQSLNISSGAQTAMSNFDSNLYSMQSMILDIDNINYSDGCEMLNPQGVEDTSLEGMLGSFIDSVKGNGNPFLITINPVYLTSAGQPGGSASFSPTSAAYRTEFCNNNKASSSSNSLNLMIMNQDHSAPNIDPSANYPVNLGPSGTSVQGLMYISASQFMSGYFQPQILGSLEQAFGQSGSHFQQSGGSWVYDYHYDDGNLDSSGYGPVVGSDSGISAIHEQTQEWIHCQVNAPINGVDGRSITISGNGYYQKQLDWWEDWIWPIDWLHDAQIQVKQCFDFTFTLQPAADGTIGITASTSQYAGTIGGNSSPHQYENPLGSFADFFASLFGGESFGDYVSQEEQAAVTWVDNSVNNFSNQAATLFRSLSTTVIMPTGSAYMFTGLQLDNQKNAQFAFQINT